jgi:hypothetical protein
MKGSRHKSPNESRSFGSSSEFPEAQAQQAIPALDMAVDNADDGQDD